MGEKLRKDLAPVTGLPPLELARFIEEPDGVGVFDSLSDEQRIAFGKIVDAMQKHVARHAQNLIDGRGPGFTSAFEPARRKDMATGLVEATDTFTDYLRHKAHLPVNEET